ncbi:MAG: aldo/keto reductase [Pseudomonadota bacterium]
MEAAIKYRSLGHTDIQLSEIGLGTMNFGANVDERTASAQLDFAVAEGVNLVDTAETYPFPPTEQTHGASESIIGRWLQKSKQRHNLYLVSKVAGPSTHLDYLRDGDLRFARPNLRSWLDDSLSRLRTDYLDIGLLHWPERATNVLGQLDYKPAKKETLAGAASDNIFAALSAMGELVAAGKLRYIGLSNETPWGVMRFLQCAAQANLTKITLIQNPYNLLNRSFDIGLAEVVHRENLGFLAYSPLAFGLLAAKHLSAGRALPDTRLTSTAKLHRYLSEDSRAAANVYFDVATRFNVELSQMAIAYSLTREYVTSVLVSASNSEQLASNINAVALNLDKSILKAIDKIHRQRPNPGL